VLSETVAVFRRYIWMGESQAVVVVLWFAAAYLHDEFEIFPRPAAGWSALRHPPLRRAGLRRPLVARAALDVRCRADRLLRLATGRLSRARAMASKRKRLAREKATTSKPSTGKLAVA
jgi:hypothetical protein